jgi:hypothetical protein
MKMIIRNGKNSQIVNLGNVTEIYPAINEEGNVFDLYFMFNATSGESCHEVKWRLSSRDEIERILLAIDVKDV